MHRNGSKVEGCPLVVERAVACVAPRLPHARAVDRAGGVAGVWSALDQCQRCGTAPCCVDIPNITNSPKKLSVHYILHFVSCSQILVCKILSLYLKQWSQNNLKSWSLVCLGITFWRWNESVSRNFEISNTAKVLGVVSEKVALRSTLRLLESLVGMASKT